MDYLFVRASCRQFGELLSMQSEKTRDTSSMSTLRKWLKRPHTYLAILAVVAALFLIDAFRAPSAQVAVPIYVGAVHTYQVYGRSLLAGKVRCRYTPTCSEYSVEAVEKYGILRGIELTAKRINRCRESVPQGTHDPIPDLFTSVIERAETQR